MTRKSNNLKLGNAGKSGKIILKKSPTYIEGLDEILEGGFPGGRCTVIRGGPGTGKTILGLEFIYRGALAGEPGIYVSFEENTEKLKENAATLGWNLEALEKKNLFFNYFGSLRPDEIIAGHFSLKGLLAALTSKADEMSARRIVLDSLDVLLRFFDKPQTVRSEMHLINNWLCTSGISTLLTVRPSKRYESAIFEEFFESMSDCIIELDSRISEQIATRRMRVLKYRGSGFQSNEYPYVISGTGIRVTPISKVGLLHKPLGRKISTGIKEYDNILHGGYRKGSCVLIAGQPGSGKTILSSVFVENVCRKGDKVLYIGFEESQDALITNVESAGIKLKPYSYSGHLEFITNYPEAMGAEMHFIEAVERISRLNPAHIIIDAISACPRMGGRLAAFEYLMRLLNYCKERGITILMINQLSGSKDFLEISGNSISSMIDTVIYMDYIESMGERNRFIQVLKSRGSGHSNQKHEFQITGSGIKIYKVYTHKGEILTGIARQAKEDEERVASEHLDYEIKRKELELEQLRKKRKNLRNTQH